MSFDLKSLQKKAEVNNRGMSKVLVSILVGAILIGALAPLVFTYFADLSNTTKNPNGPTWFGPVFLVIGAVAILLAFLKYAKVW